MKNYVIMGDVHSQMDKFYNSVAWVQNHVDNFHIVQLGDLFDSRTSYSDSIGVYQLCKELQDKNQITILQSNHQDKLIRALKGNNVSIGNGLELTLRDIDRSSVSRSEILEWLIRMSYGVVFKDSMGVEYRCAHAYFSSKLQVQDYHEMFMIKAVNKINKHKMIYGLHDSLGERVHWWTEESNLNWVRVSGHYHVLHIGEKSLVLDGGCGDVNGKLIIYDVNSKSHHKF